MVTLTKIKIYLKNWNHILLIVVLSFSFCIACNSNRFKPNLISSKSLEVKETQQFYKYKAIEPSPTTSISMPSKPTAALDREPMVIIGEKTFRVEIADSPESRQKGLSNRDFLEQTSGMLFVYPDNQAGEFWMLDMKFPLDFIWIGEDCLVVDITENVVVEKDQGNLQIYYSSLPAAFNFEVNAGEIELSNIQVGDIVKFTNIQIEGIVCDDQ